MTRVLLPVYVVEGKVRVPAATSLIGAPGWQVDLLLCPTGEDEAIEPPAFAAGLAVHRVEDLVPREVRSLQRFGGDDPELVLGESILAALIELQPRHRFGLVQFAGCGPAARVVQARRCRALPEDLAIAVELGEPGFWRRAEGSRSPTGPRDLKLDHGERLAFAEADIQIALEPRILDAVRAAEWDLGADLVTAELDPAGYRDRVRPPAAVEVRAPSSASVSVTVAHRDHARHLPGALASLARQTRPADQVVVIDDGSTDAEALRVFDEQEALYVDWTFLRQQNAGPGRTRNAGLERAEAEWYLSFDSDNLATPTMIEQLLAAVDREPSAAAVACHNLAFVEDDDIEARRFAFRYSPTGGPRILACVENVYGDTCSLFHTETLRRVGGFDMEISLPSEDWRTLVKLAAQGHRIEVLPLPLFYYRTSEAGRFRRAAADPAIQRRVRARIVEHLLDSARLSRSERRLLFDYLQAYELHLVGEDDPRLAEFRRWHESEVEALEAFGESELEKLRFHSEHQIEAERRCADAAEAELVALRSATPRRLGEAAARRLARRLDPRAKR